MIDKIYELKNFVLLEEENAIKILRKAKTKTQRKGILAVQKMF